VSTQSVLRRGRYKPVLLESVPRKTLEDDVDRLAERVWGRGHEKIRTKADFNAVYDSYLSGVSAKDNKVLREKVFKSMKRSHRNVSDVLSTTRERVRKYREAGSKPAPGEFRYAAVSGGRSVFARETYMVVKGVKKRVYRDRKGRFARAVPLGEQFKWEKKTKGVPVGEGFKWKPKTKK